MSFLQPMLLAALPLVALPILIHLINQRRYQTIRWGAMMFLLAANRMARGYARLRQYLILAMRVLAIATLVFAVSRPLAGGWLGLTAGGKAETTLILIDRSPSMRQAGPGGPSKLETGLRRLVGALKTLGSQRWVVIDGGPGQLVELESIDALEGSPVVGPADASADLPALLQTAYDYIRENNPGRTEVWIVSDLRENDWDAEGGRWAALREGYLGLPQGVRFHLLAYPDTAPANRAVRVTEVRRRDAGDGVELLVSVEVRREGDSDAKESVPLRFEIDGARSEVVVELAGPKAELKDHRIPLGRGGGRGWGRVSIPADANPGDDEYWFVHAEPAPRRTVVVAEDEAAARPLQLAAEVLPDPSLSGEVEFVGPGQLTGVDWGSAALVIWQGPLPEGEAADELRAILDRGGHALFLPPRVPAGAEFLGVRWTHWTGSPQAMAVENWRGDSGLLAHSRSGAPLPVGDLQVRRSCGLEGEATLVATLRGGAPLLARVGAGRGGAAFLATTPAPGDSSLATDGVVLYVLVQRALAAGAESLENTRQLVAGESGTGDPSGWTRRAGGEGALSTDYPRHAGIYEAGDRLLAVNRSAAESPAAVLADDRLASLFRGLDFSRLDDRAGGSAGIIQEIWRLFLVAMLGAMVAEAALCLPKKARPAGGTS
jgi:hypothetical protein